jgi:DNA mismatch repair protein MutS
MALIKEYFELTKKYQNDYGDNTILLMQVGSFFEVYAKYDKKTQSYSGSKIRDFSQICELNMVEKIAKDSIWFAGFKDFQIEKYTKKIQDAGFTVVVYTQDESTKNTTRSLAGVFSPGTYFSHDSTNLTNNVTCIWVDLVNNKMLLKGKFVVVGVANIDIYTGKTSIFQFRENYLNNPTTYDELERYISIYNPSEVVFISNLSNKEIDDVINFANIKTNSIHRINTHEENNVNKNNQFILRAKNCEKQIYQKEILNKFYNIENFDIFMQNFYENTVATQAFCFLLDFVYQHNPNLVLKISEPIFENSSERLILANHSLKQLNIIDDDNYSGKYSSVLKMLNGCLTPMGKRKFAYNFLHPTTNVEYLQREYNIVEHMLNNYEEYNDFLKINLLNIKDISKFERQIFLKKISPKMFYSLYKNIELIKDLYKKIILDNTIKEYLGIYEKDILQMNDFCDNLINFMNDNLNIELTKDLDLFQNFELNFIKRGVDVELDAKTDLLYDSESKLECIKNYLNSIIVDKGKTNEFVKIHETEKNNYSLICTDRRCKLLVSSLPSELQSINLKYNSNYSDTEREFQLKVSKSTFEFFKQSASNNCITDPQINTLCKNINSTKTLLKDLITLAYNKFIEKFGKFQAQIESIINFVTLIDIIYTKSTIAKKYNYCKPLIVESDKSFVSIKSLRHCLIERLQNEEIYVSNDITIGNGVMDGMLLYGTNAVGKTSFIRAVGISVIMAQAGLYVPCVEFIYKPYNYIFTRILGNDNLFKGLSTFAVEMSELRTILRLADKNSLILGDELCSGTENTSAVSIFVAGIQKLHNLKCSFIFATKSIDLKEKINFLCVFQVFSSTFSFASMSSDKLLAPFFF